MDKVYIYKTAHRANSVEEHLEELRRWNALPGFIGLELPSGMGKYSMKELTIRYPATMIPVLLHFRVEKWLTFKGTTNALRTDSEYEAGRQYADIIEAEHGKVDSPATDAMYEYLENRPRMRNAIHLTFSICFGILAISVLWTSFTHMLSISLTLGGIATRIILTIAIFGLFSILGYLPILTIVGNFVNGIRDTRDEFMLNQSLDEAEELGVSEVLIIAGAKHAAGLEKYAKKREIDVEIRNAPAIGYKTDDEFGFLDLLKIYFK